MAMAYLPGCPCSACKEQIKSKELSDAIQKMSEDLLKAAQAFKPWSEFANPPGYTTYNQYQGFGSIEFYKQLVTPVNSPPVREDKPSQEEVNAKWRPWFENLTAVQRKVLNLSYPDFVTVDGPFPDVLPSALWEVFEEHLKSPRSHVMYMLTQMPVLSTVVSTPCPPWCAEVNRSATVSGILMHMNDVHGWTFNDMANWLDTLGLDLSFPIPEEITEH